MSYELIAILLTGGLLGVAELVTFLYSLRVLREIQRMRRAVAGLVVQESEKIQQLLRAYYTQGNSSHPVGEGVDNPGGEQSG